MNAYPKEFLELLNSVVNILSKSAGRTNFSKSSKSRTCEHCENRIIKNREFGSKCFWAHPENYEH